MDDGLEVGVVEVEGVRGDAVDQRGAGNVNLSRTAGQRGLGRGLQHLDRCQGSVGGLVVRGTVCAAQPVHESAVRFMVHLCTLAACQVVGMGGHELGQDVRDRRSMVVGSDLSVAGHGVVFLKKLRNQKSVCLL